MNDIIKGLIITVFGGIIVVGFEYGYIPLPFKVSQPNPPIYQPTDTTQPPIGTGTNISTPQPPLPKGNAVQTADEKRLRQAAVNVVHSYYEALNRNDADSALSKRIGVKKPQKVRNLIRYIDWFRINKVSLNSFSSNYATVSIDVTGKQKTRRPERWVGTIDLEKVGGEWKITKLKLSRY